MLRRMRSMIFAAGLVFALPAACQQVCTGLGEASLQDILAELVDRGSDLSLDDLFGDED